MIMCWLNNTVLDKIHALDSKIVFQKKKEGKDCVFAVILRCKSQELEKMGVIHCCGGLRNTKTYIITPQDGYFEARFDWLESCPVCSHTVLQLTRLNINNQISIVRKVNKQARQLREKLEDTIISEIKPYNNIVQNGSSFYLFYNEYGKKKKCFSNLSQLKIGLHENVDFPKNITFNTIHQSFL